MDLSLPGGDSWVLSASEYAAKHWRLRPVGNGDRVAISSNIVKIEQLHTPTASSQYVMWRCVEEAGAQNTVREVGGGGRWNTERLCSGNV